MKIGDASIALTGDPSNWKAMLSQVESSSQSSAQNVQSSFSSALQGIAIGAGIAIFNELKSAVSDLINLIPSLIQKGQDYALGVHEIELRTGATAQESSNLAATLTFLGVNTDSLGMRLSMLAKQVYMNEQRFTDLGIATRDSNGQLLNGVALLDSIRQRYSDLGDGIQKAAIAQELIGRGGGDLLQYLSLSDAQVSQLSAEWSRLGLILDDAGVQKAVDVQREQALLGLALTSVGNALDQAVAPAVTSFTDALVNLVEVHGPEIEAFFVRITGFVLGLISALTGFDTSGAGTFLANFNLNAAAAGDAAATTASQTADLTSALDAQTTALTAQDAALKALATDEEREFQSKMKQLGGAVAAQINQIDAAEKAVQVQRQQEQQARDLRDAEQALSDAQLSAQGVKPGDTSGAQRAAEAVASAEERIAQLRQTAADFAVTQTEDANKARLQADQTYLTDLAQLESQATNKKALVNTLAARERALLAEQEKAKAAGDAAELQDIAIRLEGVKTAQAQAGKASRIQSQEDEITAAKAAIESEKTALSTVPPIEQKITDALDPIRQKLRDIATGTTGPGGLVGAMQEGEAAGKAMAASVKGAFDAVTGSVGAAVNIVSSLTSLISGIDPVLLGTGLMALGVSTGNPILALAGASLAGYGVTHAGETSQPLGNAGPGRGSRVPESASGALMGAGSSGGGSWTGSPVVPGTAGTSIAGSSIVPRTTAPALAGGAGGPVTLNINLDGKTVAKVVDEHLAYMPGKYVR